MANYCSIICRVRSPLWVPAGRQLKELVRERHQFFLRRPADKHPFTLFILRIQFLRWWLEALFFFTGINWRPFPGPSHLWPRQICFSHFEVMAALLTISYSTFCFLLCPVRKFSAFKWFRWQIGSSKIQMTSNFPNHGILASAEQHAHR